VVDTLPTTQVGKIYKPELVLDSIRRIVHHEPSHVEAPPSPVGETKPLSFQVLPATRRSWL
jgi:hypothetical protein